MMKNYDNDISESDIKLLAHKLLPEIKKFKKNAKSGSRKNKSQILRLDFFKHNCYYNAIA